MVDVSLPALVFTQMVRTVERDTWRADLSMLLVSAVVMLVALGTGWVAAFVRSPRESRPTFAFFVGVPNWMYLPLPIAQELYGEAGVRAVLIGNIGAQLLLWTLGVATLRGRIAGAGALRQTLLNPGIVSAFAGIAVALLWPRVGSWVDGGGEAASIATVVRTGFVSLEMLGAITVPVSLLLIGAQLGGFELRRAHPCRCVNAVLIARLIVAPVLTLALLSLAASLGMQVAELQCFHRALRGPERAGRPQPVAGSPSHSK